MLTAFDFFCGAGGLTRGLSDAGIKVIAGFDLDVRCRETYERNNSSKFYDTDIGEITAGYLRQIAGVRSFANFLFAGCAPCQPFSQQRKSPLASPDATLLLKFAGIVEACKPGFVLIENVPGMARVRGNSTYRKFLKTLEQNRYKYWEKVHDAKHFGVPQTRRRLLVIASRFGEPLPLNPVFGTTGRPYRTVREAISHFPKLECGQSHPRIPNHVAASLSPINLERLRHTPSDGGDRRSWPRSLRLSCHNHGLSGYTDTYGRMAWNLPAPTLTGKCHSISNGRYGHPEQDRAISLREAATLQSFPDDYVFYGFNTHIALQIGNAVPVLFAKHLGKHILAMNSSRK